MRNTDQKFKRPDIWIGALLGTGLFVFSDALANVGQGEWIGHFLSGTLYLHLVIIVAAGHYLAKGSRMPSTSKTLLSGFMVLPLALLLGSAILTPTYWFVGYGNWGIIFSGLCSKILPTSLLVFVLLALGQNFKKERARVKEYGCYLFAGLSSFAVMAWLEGSVGMFSGIILSFILVSITVISFRQAKAISALRCSRN